MSHEGPKVTGLLDAVSIDGWIAWWAVTDRRVAKHWGGSLIYELIEFELPLDEVLPEVLHLCLVCLHQGKIDSIVVLDELLLSSELDPVQSPWVVPILFLDLFKVVLGEALVGPLVVV